MLSHSFSSLWNNIAAILKTGKKSGVHELLYSKKEIISQPIFLFKYLHNNRIKCPTHAQNYYYDNYEIIGGLTVREFNSGFPTWYSFEKILNEIPCVNSILLFLLNIDFEYQIQNCHCSQNSYQDNLLPFVLAWNSNTSLSHTTSSLSQASCYFPCLTQTFQVVMRNVFVRTRCN